MPEENKPTIRDRVKELKRVRAGDLIPHPQNWRTHDAAQKEALAGAVSELGFAGAILAREIGDGKYQILDGHARQEMDEDALLPVLVTDLTEEEGKKLLMTFDPLGAMAKADAVKLDSLLTSVQVSDGRVSEMLKTLAIKSGCESVKPKKGATDADAVPELSHEPVTKTGDVWLLGAYYQCEDCGKVYDFETGRKMKECPCG